MPNGLASLIHKINLPNFQGCWGEVKKLSEKKFVKKFQRATEQIGKRLLPGPGETVGLFSFLGVSLFSENPTVTQLTVFHPRLLA